MHNLLELNVPTFIEEVQDTEEPKSVRIVLGVCQCYSNDKLTFITEKAKMLAQLLGITLEDLECHAVSAMLTGQPQVVACYKSHDLGATKLAQLQAQLPFISRPCHSFEILN